MDVMQRGSCVHRNHHGDRHEDRQRRCGNISTGYRHRNHHGDRHEDRQGIENTIAKASRIAQDASAGAVRENGRNGIGCGHTANVVCSQHSCSDSNERLRCGHTANVVCSQPPSGNVSLGSRCGHTANVVCSQPSGSGKSTIARCGHTANVVCSQLGLELIL